MTHRMSLGLAAALAVCSIGCTDDGGNDTGADDLGDSSGDGDGDGDTGDGDGDTGDGDGDTGDGDGDTGDGDGDGDATGGDVEFADVFQLFVDQGCTAGYCHGAGQAGLTMTDANTTYMNLVNVDAMLPVCGLTKRVVPSAPNESILWMRVRPIALDGPMPCAMIKMPNNGMTQGLSEANGQIVYDWIAGGALP